MVEQARRLRRNKDERSFDMRALWRLAIWGAAATASLAMVALAASTNEGSQRLITAMAPVASQPSTAELAARSAETENEMRRLSEAVRVLDANRERLLTRITSLERSLDDITGAIRRQAASAPTNPAPREPDLPAIESAQATTAVSPPTPAAAAQPAAPVSPPTPAAAAQPSAVSPPAPAADRIAAVSAVAEAVEAKSANPEMAVDVGGAVNFDGLRLLWHSTKGAHVALFEDLHPLVAVRENRRTRAVELRLLVGPFADFEAAAAVCAALAGVRRYCQPATFEGQLFSLAEPEGRPVAPPVRRPAPAPKAARPNP
jgi:hypothetical protein